jgi:hypothetical protein
LASETCFLEKDRKKYKKREDEEEEDISSY